MKRSLFAAAAMLLMATTAQAAQVQSGAWTVYDAPGEAGTPLCGLSVNGDQQRSLHIKYILGDTHFTMMMFKPSWRFPSGGVSLPLTIWLDEQNYSTNNARGVPDPKTGAMVIATVPNKILDEFLKNFGEANRMSVRFDSGNEVPWTVNMVGSRYAAKLFAGCVTNLIGKNPTTQPYGQPQATQPYGAPPATQPYGNSAAPPRPTAPQPRPRQRDDGGI
jgi:hypothetical protein